MGPYEVLEVLGKGGMGTVYRGRHRETGRMVALKVLAKDLASQPVFLKRFEQEFATASRLCHPHIVQGLAFGMEAGRPYLVLELVEGQTLGGRIREQGPLSESEAVRLTVQVADALRLVHQHKLIHRDVKPDNILLTGDGQAKLTDLGLVKDLKTGIDLTTTRIGLGTLVYVAPEQLEDARSADVRCDVYGLGATLYHAVTGVVPFQGRTYLELLCRKARNEFVPPLRLAPSLSRHVNEAISQRPGCLPRQAAAVVRSYCRVLARCPGMPR